MCCCFCYDEIKYRYQLEFEREKTITLTGWFSHVSTGPPLPKSRFVVAVNWSGVFFMDGREKRLLELSYLEVKKADKTR